MNTIADASPQVSASLLITTYNWPDALEKVFWGLFAQTRRDFEVIIADDGSRPETGELIARMAARSPIPIVHVWQPDEGFGKCRILNKAMARRARGADHRYGWRLCRAQRFCGHASASGKAGQIFVGKLF